MSLLVEANLTNNGLKHFKNSTPEKQRRGGLLDAGVGWLQYRQSAVRVRSAVVTSDHWPKEQTSPMATTKLWESSLAASMFRGENCG